jgi:outer membrane lipoprotein-sorting protein
MKKSMKKGTLFNWKIENEYKDGGGQDLYVMEIGSMLDMYQAVYDPLLKKLTISNLSYDNSDSQTFHCIDLDFAETMVESFSKGMNLEILPLFKK